MYYLNNDLSILNSYAFSKIMRKILLVYFNVWYLLKIHSRSISMFRYIYILYLRASTVVFYIFGDLRKFIVNNPGLQKLRGQLPES